MADNRHWTEDSRQLERVVDPLETTAAARRNLDRVLLRMFHGRPITMPNMNVNRASQSLQDFEIAKAGGFSLAREIGDAAAALVVRMPSMKVLPVGQQFSRHRGAKMMSRYLNGVFYANKVKRMAPALFQDEICTRMGALKVYVAPRTSEIKFERLNSLWLLYDEDEGPNPSCLYYVAPASKRWLLANYPDKASEIENLPSWTPTQVPMVGFGMTHDKDTVRVVEAWALPRGKEPGKHVIQVGKGID